MPIAQLIPLNTQDPSRFVRSVRIFGIKISIIARRLRFGFYVSASARLHKIKRDEPTHQISFINNATTNLVSASRRFRDFRFGVCVCLCLSLSLSFHIQSIRVTHIQPKFNSSRLNSSAIFQLRRRLSTEMSE